MKVIRPVLFVAAFALILTGAQFATIAQAHAGSVSCSGSVSSSGETSISCGIVIQF